MTNTSKVQLPYVNQPEFKYEQTRSAPLSRKQKASACAIHQSILDGRVTQLTYFLQMGADPNSKDKYGRSCLTLACLSDHEDYGIQVAKILLKNNADINFQDNLGRTPVFLSCSENREKLFNLFLDVYYPTIDYRLKDNDGNVLINHVAMYGSIYMLRKLVEKMNLRKVETDQRNNLGYTALLLAIKHDKYLNAYYLIKDGQSSTNLKDSEFKMNAIEWLFSRINANKDKILSNEIESGSPSPTRHSSNPNYKTWYGSLNQYYMSGPCEHVTSPNLSTEYSKSRYIPLILKNKTLNLENIQPVRSKMDFYKYYPKSNESLSEGSSLVSSEYSEDLDEGLSVKDVVQKLYELIFRKMSQSMRTQSILPDKYEHEKPKTQTRRQSLTARQRSHSIKLNDFPKIEEVKEKIELLKQPSKTEVKPDGNIFDLEELRYTPRLIAISEKTTTSARSAKDMVHKMFDMYDSTPMTSRNETRKMSVVENDLPKIFNKMRKSHSNSVASNNFHVKFKD